MPQFSMYSPLNERDLHDDFRPCPVGAETRQPFSFREWRFRSLDLVESRSQIQQQLCIEACADFAGKDEIITVEVAHEERPKPDAGTLRISKTSHDQFLRRLT